VGKGRTELKGRFPVKVKKKKNWAGAKAKAVAERWRRKKWKGPDILKEYGTLVEKGARPKKPTGRKPLEKGVAKEHETWESIFRKGEISHGVGVDGEVNARRKVGEIFAHGHWEKGTRERVP